MIIQVKIMLLSENQVKTKMKKKAFNSLGGLVKIGVGAGLIAIGVACQPEITDMLEQSGRHFTIGVGAQIVNTGTYAFGGAAILKGAYDIMKNAVLCKRHYRSLKIIRQDEAIRSNPALNTQDSTYQGF
jgi:hypothetical protein